MADGDITPGTESRRVHQGEGDVVDADSVKNSDKNKKNVDGESAKSKHIFGPGLRRELRLFIKITAMHGIKRFWEANNYCSKAFWGIAVGLCMFVMCTMLYMNISDHVSDNGSTQLNQEVNSSGMILPKVTFCKNHPIKKSLVDQLYNGLSEELKGYIILSNKDPSMLTISNDKLIKLHDDFEKYVKTRSDFEFRSFFEETGFKCNDIFKSCSFAGEPFECCVNNTERNIEFKTTLTELGLCHTIKANGKSNQSTESENGGFQFILDAQTKDFVSLPINTKRIFDYPLSEGYRFFLEEEDMHTYRSAHGISVSPGQSIFSGIQLNQYKDERNEHSFDGIFKWMFKEDSCRSDWDNTELTGGNTKLKYQARDCRSMCLAKLYNATCNCAPIVFDIDREYRECSPKEAFTCTKDSPNIQSAKSFAAGTYCDMCKVECDRWDYQSYNSYGGPLSESAADAILSIIGKDPERSRERVQKDFIVVSIFYRELSSFQYVAAPSAGIVSLLSTIGGTAGLCLGFSFLTFIEVVVLIVKSFCFCAKMDKQNKKGEAYTADKELEKKAIADLKKAYGNDTQRAQNEDLGYVSSEVTPANLRRENGTAVTINAGTPVDVV